LPFDKTEGRRLVNSCLSLIRQAIDRHGFLEKNSRVLVGVSGGTDSLLLLLLLIEYQQKFHQKWEIHACHINAQFPDWEAGNVKKFFVEQKVPYTIIKTDIYKKIKNIKNKCYFCARERRKKLLETADKLGIFQIALAHHKQDVVETVFLNMMYNGEISTLVPKQPVIQGRFFFIRPIYYIDKEKIQRLAQIYRLPITRNICPYYKDSKREMVRNFLDSIKEKNPDVYKNMFRGVFHIKKTYMP
jgi:tRNA 2-thiocytidine biosynthesis protein TtcA